MPLRPLSELTRDLPHANVPAATELVARFGYYEAARLIGSNIDHYHNLVLAGRLAVEHLYDQGPESLEDYLEIFDRRLNHELKQFYRANLDPLNLALQLNRNRDQDHDWLSANTIVSTYAAKTGYKTGISENVDQMWLRVASQLYLPDLSLVLATYQELVNGAYTPATPTILNGGMIDPQLASCFLLQMDDTTESIVRDTTYRSAQISKKAGGIGIDISLIRHSEIGEAGYASGIVKMLQIYNALIPYIDQSGTRKGAATIHLRPFHLDFPDFINLARKVGHATTRTHDLNLSIWTCHIFWRRVITDGIWTMFCPKRVPELNDLVGQALTAAYLAAEADPTIKPHHRKTTSARKLWFSILSVQKEAGMPFIMNGDGACEKSNHRHLGHLQTNLCLEIIQHTSPDEISVCNLHSLSLPYYVVDGQVDFGLLGAMTRKVVRNLNSMIDRSWLPLDDTKDPMSAKLIRKTNDRQRPIGIGVSGFADLLHKLDLPFNSEGTKILNKQIFACIYWHAIVSSVELALTDGPCEVWAGSPMSEGKFQFDLWAEEFAKYGPNDERLSSDLDRPVTFPNNEFSLSNGDHVLPTWEDLRRVMVKYGCRNSLFTALMPTATSAHLRRNCESVEAHQSNLYARMTLSSTYPVLNRFMVDDLMAIGCWNHVTTEFLKKTQGSIQDFDDYVEAHGHYYPQFTDRKRLSHVIAKYQTMWELPQKLMMDLAADRARYIDQSASTTVYMEDCEDDKLTACYIYAYLKGLKTIVYYLRQTGAKPAGFTADLSLIESPSTLAANVDVDVCRMGAGCLPCGS